MARGNFATKLLDACDEGLLEWEALARECVAYMSGDDCESVTDALGLNDDEDEDDDDDDDEDEDDEDDDEDDEDDDEAYLETAAHVVDNFINGNLRDARELAKAHDDAALREALELAYSPLKAARALAYLRSGEGFQLYADTP